MTTLPAPALSDISIALAIAFTFLVPLALAGIALINSGLGRSRSAAHMMMAAVIAAAVAAAVYFVVGFAWQGYIGGPAYFFTMHCKSWNWIAAAPFLFRHLEFSDSAQPLAALLSLFAVGLAAIIPLGSGADRWRLSAICASTALLAGMTFPLFAHWTWGGGWLAQLGANFGLGRGFVDSGGSAAIQAVGGLTALSVAWLIEPRHGKYSRGGMPIAIPGHNSVLTLLGCLLALVGWLGLNGAGAILFTGIEPGRVVLVAINTMLSAVSSGLTAAIITRIRFGRPDASLTANGWVAGLAASSAGCAFFVPAGAVLTGAVAGALVIFTVELLELQLGVDDPCGAISTHGVGGIWGVLAVAMFAQVPPLGGDATAANPGQWLAQIVGLATLFGFILPFTYGLNWLLNRFHPQRVSSEGEQMGMDLHELGAGAYPEFITHSEEFTQRNF